MSTTRNAAARPAQPPAEQERQSGPAPGARKGEPDEKAGGRPPGVSEIGGPKGPEPTRFGDWEKGGRCTDF